MKSLTKIITLTNVITLVGKDAEAYALSYYPAMNRYASVADGSLVSVPITNLDTGASLYVYFSENAYSMHPQIRDLVNKLYLAVENFSAHYSSAKNRNSRLHTTQRCPYSMVFPDQMSRHAREAAGTNFCRAAVRRLWTTGNRNKRWRKTLIRLYDVNNRAKSLFYRSSYFLRPIKKSPICSKYSK